MGCVYILTNPAFKENWVKIGMSSRNVDVRAKELDNTAVPLPFEVYAILETSYYAKAEHHVHQMLDLMTKTRIRKSREFFNISPEKAYDILCSVKELLPDGNLKKVNVPIEESTSAETSSATSWIIPANKAFFDLEKCFNDLGGVYWKQKHAFSVGDIVYVYSAKPDKCVRYKCRVKSCNVPYNNGMEKQSKYDLGNKYLTDTSTYAYIEYIGNIVTDKLGYKQLKEHGLKGTMLTGIKCSAELASFIEAISKNK